MYAYPSGQTGRWAGISLVLTAAVLALAPAVAQNGGLLAFIRAFPGEYVAGTVAGQPTLSDPAGLDAGVTAQPGTLQDKLETLVGCFSDFSASKVTLDGRPVPVGMVCYEALTKLVYYESKDAAWGGYLRPGAANDRLAAAQKAWQSVVSRKAYTKL